MGKGDRLREARQAQQDIAREQLRRARERLAENEAETARRAASGRLLPFIKYTKPDYLSGWFHERLCAGLEWFESEVRAGKRPRLIIEAPPRHGKTEATTRRFPVWAMARNPGWELVCASYNKDLADDNSRDAREIARDELAHAVFPGIRLTQRDKRYYSDYRRADVDQVDNWKIGNGASYKAAGVGTALSGRGAKVLIIDDPFKDRAEADSAARRALVKKWFTSTASTRLAPGGGIIIMATRWDSGDLTGAVLDAAEHGGDQWVRLSFPAIAEEDEYEAGCPWDDHPEPYDPDSDGPAPPLLRRKGEALFPGEGDVGFDLDELNAIRAALHSLGRGRDWEALYQQRPVAEGGNKIKREWFLERWSGKARDLALQADEVWLTSDTAKKAGQHNDFHVIQCWCRIGEKRYLLDRVAGQMGYPVYEQMMDGQITKWADLLREKGGVLIEDTVNGATYMQIRGPAVGGVPLIAFDPTKDTPGKNKGKPARATYLIRAGESRAIILPSSSQCPWVEDVIAWWCAFPMGAHDDDVDTASQLMMRWTLKKDEPAHNPHEAITALRSILGR